MTTTTGEGASKRLLLGAMGVALLLAAGYQGYVQYMSHFEGPWPGADYFVPDIAMLICTMVTALGGAGFLTVAVKGSSN